MLCGARARSAGYCKERFSKVFCTRVLRNPIPMSNTFSADRIVEGVAGLLAATDAGSGWPELGGIGLSTLGRPREVLGSPCSGVDMWCGIWLSTGGVGSDSSLRGRRKTSTSTGASVYVQTIQGCQRHTAWKGHEWLSLPMSASEQGLHGVPPSHSRRFSRQDMQTRSILDRQRAWFSVVFCGGRLLGWRLLQVL